MKMLKLIAVIAGGCALACTSKGRDQEDDEARAGLLAVTKIQWSEFVRGVDYTAIRVPCPGELGVDPATYTASVGVESLYLPSGIPAFEQAPLDPDSAHMFADQYFLLPEGCYDVEAVPLDASGNPSDVCYAAHQLGVEVIDGLTTEILLISQCLGPGRGGLDAIVALNNPPLIEDLEFDPSKFVSSCEGVEICLTASDPDNDPLEFEWEQVSGPDIVHGPTITSTTLNMDGTTTQCVLVQSGVVDTYEMKVTVYDLAWINGTLTRIEELLADQGDPLPSRDDLVFPVHAAVDCPVEGRSVVILLTMSNDPGLMADAQTLAVNSVNWVHGLLTDPQVLVVLDDAHHGENAGDAIFVHDLLAGAGFNVDYLNEPASGLSLADVENYDVVWFSNPGYPMDDAATHATLLSYRAAGGGLILQGDDMARFESYPDLMQPLTYLDWLNNGTMACGVHIDNNVGDNYSVTFNSTTHPVIAGLEGVNFDYGNDIDHTTPLGLGEEIMATASFTKDDCSVETSAIVAIDPAKVSPWGP